jgi:alkylhydroperoxidase/carboxymuconolactone decarboxylase family protein YurZ
MNPHLPANVEKFKQEHPDVWKAFTALADACHKAGPLDERSRRLVKLALSVGAGLEGATHSAVRNGLAAGLTAAEMQHVAALAMSTTGFPAGMRALTWIADGLEGAKE